MLRPSSVHFVFALCGVLAACGGSNPSDGDDGGDSESGSGSGGSPAPAGGKGNPEGGSGSSSTTGGRSNPGSGGSDVMTGGRANPGSGGSDVMTGGRANPGSGGSDVMTGGRSNPAAGTGGSGATAGTGEECDAGLPCDDPNPCVALALTDCSTGMEQCVAESMLPDGTNCGSDKVCRGGACVACDEGASCEVDGEECKTGTLSCATGTPVCEVEDNAPNGSSCTDGVCYYGECEPCEADKPCGSASTCHEGRTSCASGQELCVQTSTSLADGTSCGTNSFCYSGSCQGCQAGGSCTPAEACKTGTYGCMPAPNTCEATGNAPNGSYCGSNQVCDTGTCVACEPNAACVPANPCKLGTLSCTSGPSCTQSPTNAPDDTVCGTDRICTAGTCLGANRTLEITAGGTQSKRINESSDAISVRVRDSGGTAIAGAKLTITAPPGAYAPSIVTTNASGIATFQVRLGRAVGSYAFTLASTGAPPTTLTFTAAAPSSGHVFTLVNLDRTWEHTPLPAAGPVSRIGYPTDVVVAAQDGSLYLTEGCRVLKLTPAGELRRIAGTENCGFLGDLGPAVDARLTSPESLALDEANGLLYIADTGNRRIRVLDLASGVIDTFAGGGSAPGPTYGDNGPANSAAFGRPDHIMIGPDGGIYVSDAEHARLRRIDPLTNIVTAWLDSGACNGRDVKLYSCGWGCDVAWNASGAAFISGYICAPGSDYYPGILRRDPNGTMTHIAGRNTTGSSSADGVAAQTALFPDIHSLALDPAGNLYLSQKNGSKIRRIDGANGKISTIAGTGTDGFSGEYAAASTALLRAPAGLTFDLAGNLYIADTNNISLRSIWRGGNTTPSTATLSAQAGTGQTGVMGALLGSPFGALLRDGSSVVIRGVNVSWRALDLGAGLYTSTSTTATTGIATASARTGLLPGSYRYEASFRTIHGQHVTGSPLVFTATATAPARGTVFPVVNFNIAAGFSGTPGPGPFAQIDRPRAVRAASDGTLYLAAGCTIYRLSPVGHLEIIAGSNSCSSTETGSGPALGASFYTPDGLALDEARQLLYVLDYYAQVVRVIDLTTGLIDAFAGGGSAPAPGYGDGGPASVATLAMPQNISLDSQGNVYISDVNHNRVRKVDRATGIISNWLPIAAACNGTVTGVLGCSSNQGCVVEFDAADNAYVTGSLCVNGVYKEMGILKRAPNGTYTHIAGRSQTGGTTIVDGVAATSAYLPNLVRIALDSSNNVYITMGDGKLIRRIDAATGLINTIIGDGTAGNSEYVPSTSSRVGYPISVSRHPNGGIVFGDYNNFAFRRIY